LPNAESFEQKMIQVMNNASLALMLSVGHRTNLLDSISKLPPSSSIQIALASGLNERYVREWLGAMVTSKIIHYDHTSGLYSLSKEKADFLTRNGKYNFASSMQFIPVLAHVEDHIVNCFQKGGGVPYESFNRFHDVMAEESEQTVLSALIEKILPIVPEFPEKLESGINVLDIGCGSGRAINLMAEKFPNSSFIGYDISREAIENARVKVKNSEISNVSFENQDVSNFTKEKHFDLITAFDAIHDQAEPQKVLENIRKSLKPGGVFLMQDIRASTKLEENMEHPLAPYLYSVSCLHCMTVSLAQGGKGLGAMWGKELAITMLKKAGFSNIRVLELPHDPINYYYVVRI